MVSGQLDQATVQAISRLGLYQERTFCFAWTEEYIKLMGHRFLNDFRLYELM
jgi:hypothetical protein